MGGQCHGSENAPNPGEGTGGDTGSTSLNPPGPQVRAGSFQANDTSER